MKFTRILGVAAALAFSAVAVAQETEVEPAATVSAAPEAVPAPVEALEVDGANLFVAAMLSPTGRSEPLVQDVAFTLIPGDQHFALPHFTALAACSMAKVADEQATFMSKP